MLKYLVLFCITVNLFAQDKELQELKSEIEILLQKIQEYEKKTDQSFLGEPNLELKNKKTVLSVGGRIQVIGTYGWPEGSLFAGKIPLDDTGENGQLSMNARDSRLWIKTRTPTEDGMIRTLIEIDFWGSSGTENNTNSHNPRLRHAYAQLDGWMVGQTNSAFNSLVTLETISFIINDTMVRQPLIRYSLERGNVNYDISFEQPETTLLDVSGDIVTPKDDVYPDLVLRSRVYTKWGEGSVAFLGRYINQDSYAPYTNRDSALGWGINTSLKVKLFGLDDIRLDAQYGIGLGRYISYNAYSAGSLDASGHIELQATYGAHIGYRHWWSKNLRSTLAVSMSATDNNLENIALVNREKVNRAAYSSHLNLMYSLFKNALIGSEYSYGTRVLESDERANISLLRFLFRYDF